jgi:hypothetical protein
LLYRISSILHWPLYAASLISSISSTDFHQSITLMKPSLTHILINLKSNWLGFLLRRKSNSSQSFLAATCTKMALLYQSSVFLVSANKKPIWMDRGVTHFVLRPLHFVTTWRLNCYICGPTRRGDSVFVTMQGGDSCRHWKSRVLVVGWSHLF